MHPGGTLAKSGPTQDFTRFAACGVTNGAGVVSEDRISGDRTRIYLSLWFLVMSDLRTSDRMCGFRMSDLRIGLCVPGAQDRIGVCGMRPRAVFDAQMPPLFKLAQDEADLAMG